MSQAILTRLKQLKSLTRPTPLVYDKFYTDTLMNYPDGYDSKHKAFNHKPEQFIDIEKNKKTYTCKGGKACLICMEKKPVKTTHFCRQCHASVCASCYNKCRHSNVLHTSANVGVIAIRPTHPDRTQPKCPACRGVGTFGTKGVMATRMVSFKVPRPPPYDNSECEFTFGPVVTDDVILKGHVKGYITEYNRVLAILCDKIDTEVEQGLADVVTIHADVKYNDLESDINRIEGVIADYQQAIRELQSNLYSKRNEREKYVEGLMRKEDEVTQEWFEEKGIPLLDLHCLPLQDNEGHKYKIRDNIAVAIKSLENNHPRRFFHRDVDKQEDDVGIAQSCYLSQFVSHNYRGKTGRAFQGIHKFIALARERYDFLMTGAIQPVIKMEVTEMSDAELTAQMDAIQATMDARKAQRQGGATKEE